MSGVRSPVSGKGTIRHRFVDAGAGIARSGLLLAAFLTVLSGCSSQKTVSALLEEAGRGDAGAMRDLVRAMGSPERERALEAYNGVIGLGPVMVPGLMRGLESSDPAVMEASAAALGSMGSTSSIGPLMAMLEGRRPRRYAAAWALGEIGDPSAVAGLTRALSDSDPTVRKEAVRALVKIGGDVPREVLVLVQGTTEPLAARSAIRVLGELRAAVAVEPLASVEGRNRDAAVWALGRIGHPAALGTLLEALDDDRWQVRREAAEALGYLEMTEAVGPLEKALSDPEPVVREWAARSLETLTGRQVLYEGEDGELVPPYNLYR
ncbi:MAG: HEAT repeat domain-containing protein [bacterium]|nr:MAG: HEAT repeat domain-containing protein [bacterium]